MAYTGQYTDNLPFICAAGVRNTKNFTAGECLKEYTLEDSIQALKTDLHIPKQEYIPIKLPTVAAVGRSPGIYTEVRELLNPPPLTRYRELINDLKETTYQSYWNKRLGAVPDAHAAFPKGMKVDEITFGDPYNYEASVKDLIQPPKTPSQVLWESQVNHDAYKKIYGSYNPGERVERGYASPPFDPNKAFGKSSGYDKRGLKTKCCMEWYKTSPLTIVSRIQGDCVDKTKDKLGKCHEPNRRDILNKLPPDFTFGIPHRRCMYGIEDLLRDSSVEIPAIVKEMRPWLVSFNRLKIAIATKISPTFDHSLLYEEMVAFDKDKSGYITFGSLLEVMRCNDIFFNIGNVKALMEFLGIVVGERVDYGKFLDALKDNLDLGKIQVPGNNRNFLSIYQASYCDSTNPNNIVCDTSTKKEDQESHTDKYAGFCDFTDVKTCLEPTIFTQYGLSHRDFFCPRDGVLIRSLFKKIGYDLSDENFEKLWEMGKKIDGSDMVCVQTFRDLLDKYFPLHIKLNVDGIK